MSKQKLFMLVWDIDINKGGINHAMFIRSSAFADLYDSKIITLDYKDRYPQIEKTLKQQGKLDNKVSILNIHDYYLEKFNIHQIPKRIQKQFIEASQKHEVEFTTSIMTMNDIEGTGYFENGILKKIKYWNEEDILTHIDYYNTERAVTLREEYKATGYLARKIFYDTKKNTPSQIIHFSNTGLPFLVKWMDSKKGKIMDVFLLKENQNDEYIHFKNNRDFSQHWLNLLCADEKTQPIIICDGPGSSSIISRLDPSVAYKVMMIHSNHFGPPHRYGSPIKRNHEWIFNNLNDFHSIVVLTESQYDDIEKQFGEIDHLTVIPHSVRSGEKVATYPEKDPKLVAMVARYHPEKRLDLAIKAMQLVVKQIPDAKLKLYGNGIDKNRLNTLITELNLSNNVTLEGYISNPTLIYQQASTTLTTSKFEGFSLSITESMENYTPAISFDIPYGPSDIIRHGVNGYLVEDEDIDALAFYIIDLLNNPDKVKRMGIAAHNFIHDMYNYNNYYQKWLQLLRSLN